MLNGAAPFTMPGLTKNGGPLNWGGAWNEDCGESLKFPNGRGCACEPYRCCPSYGLRWPAEFWFESGITCWSPYCGDCPFRNCIEFCGFAWPGSFSVCTGKAALFTNPSWKSFIIFYWKKKCYKFIKFLK